MLYQFEGETADAVWRDAAAAIISGENAHRQDSRIGPTRELLHCSFLVRSSRQRWVHSRWPPINPAFGLAEVVWILMGRNDAEFLNFWNPLLPKFAGNTNLYYGAYGHRLRVSPGFDQLERAYQALSCRPDSRQVVLQIWDGQLDFPNSDGSSRSEDIPCNVCAMPKIRAGRLEWLQVMRSNDLYLGTPHNFVQFTTLQEVLAGWLGIEPGNYVQIADSLHVYEHDLPALSIADVPHALNTDTLALPKPEFDRVLPLLGAAIDRLRTTNLVQSEFSALMRNAELPEGWQNVLRILAADSARRRGWWDEMALVGEACTNPALAAAWTAWERRRRRGIGRRSSDLDSRGR